MKQDIENIIRKNLPEKKEECPEYPCQKCNSLGYTAEHDLPSRHGEDGECVSCPIQVQCEECQATGMIGFPDDKNIGFNQALSQINTSLIADEVLKVVKKIGLRWYDDTYHHGKQEDGSTTFITEKEFDEFIKLLSEHLSPHNENKSNSRNY